ncbi:MAG: hypothetical protein P8Z77_06765 [Candidatus Thiodiazotropha sp.]
MDIQYLLDLRKITQAISRKFEVDLKAHLTTLAPLFSPRQLFGEFVRGGSKSSGLQAEKAYRELSTRFKSIAEQKPFSLNASLSPPLDLFDATPVLTPLEYTYTAHSGETSHQINVTSPLKWAISYPDTGPKRVRELVAGERGNQVEEELSHALLQTIAMAILFEQRPGLVELFQALRFPLQIRHLDGLGALPVLTISAPLEVRLPEDDIIIQNTQLTGIPSFEEVTDAQAIRHLTDPIRQELIAIAQSLSPAVYSEIAG